MGVIKLGIDGRMTSGSSIKIGDKKEYTYVRFYEVECVIVSDSSCNMDINPYSPVFGSAFYGDIIITKYEGTKGFNNEELKLIKLTIGNRHRLSKLCTSGDSGYITLDDRDIFKVSDKPLYKMLEGEYNHSTIGSGNLSKYVMLYLTEECCDRAKRNVTASRLLDRPVYGEVIFTELDDNRLDICDSLRKLKNSIQAKMGGALGEYYSR